MSEGPVLGEKICRDLTLDVGQYDDEGWDDPMYLGGDPDPRPIFGHFFLECILIEKLMKCLFFMKKYGFLVGLHLEKN